MLCDKNGYIQIPIARDQEGERTLDAEGFPIKPQLEWSDPIPCQWRTKSWDNTSRSLDEPTLHALYSILIEYRYDLPTPERVRLINRGEDGQIKCDNEIELQVVEARPLRAVRKYLIEAK